MSLGAGTRLGPYEIIAPLGVGGMGEVYRARDTTLHRDVAIKVLLAAVANDPDRLARFGREAQVLASLNHPHIAHIYGVEDTGGVKALVLELVDGEDLAQRIARGPIPLDEALAIARQIADALEAAHEQSVIHRDLKPANIKVRPDGTIKILDFGLAKALDPAGASGVAAMNSPTLSLHATQAGLILGTAAYMSPEQARGGLVDRRADIWAFGVVLFEMLAGKRVFEGDTVSDTLASVLKSEPDPNALPADVPPAILRLLALCLKKDRKARLSDAGEARRQIDDVIAGGVAAEPVATNVSRPAPRWRRAAPWMVAAAAVAVAVALTARGGGDRRAEPPIYASIDAPTDHVLGEDDNLAWLPTRTPLVFTPDGRSLVIQAAVAAKPQLFLRPLDRPDARPIAGTDDAHVPFVSPDGKWIGFWAGNELRKVPIEGGAATTICQLPATLGPNGAVWAGEFILYGDDASGRIMRVPASGGTPVAVTAAPSLASGRRYVAPSVLPDGKRVLFSDVSPKDASDSRLMVQSLDGGDARLVLASATDGRVLKSGQLAFMRLGTLMVTPFDTARAAVTGSVVAAMSGVMQSGLRGRLGAMNTGAGMFAVSNQGTLAAIRGPLTGSPPASMIWVTPDGRPVSAEPATGSPAGGRLFTRISPDGSRAVVAVQTPLRMETWLADWSRDVWNACGDCNGERGLAIWSRDGRQLLLARGSTLVTHTLDGSAPDHVAVSETDRYLLPVAWLADGRMVYLSSPDQAAFEIRMTEPGGSAGTSVVPLGVGSDADVSPDGRWLAYTTVPDLNVVVQAFPGPGARTQVSAGGGRNPAWSQDGRTLYYLDATRADRPGSNIIAVDLNSDHGITAGRPRVVLHRPDGQGCANSRCYEIASDGRFLLRDRPTAGRQSVTRIDLVLNWAGTLAK